MGRAVLHTYQHQGREIQVTQAGNLDIVLVTEQKGDILRFSVFDPALVIEKRLRDAGLDPTPVIKPIVARAIDLKRAEKKEAEERQNAYSVREFITQKLQEVGLSGSTAIVPTPLEEAAFAITLTLSPSDMMRLAGMMDDHRAVRGRFGVRT